MTLMLFLEGTDGAIAPMNRNTPERLRRGFRPTGRWWLVECYNPAHGLRVIEQRGPVKFMAGGKPIGRLVDEGGYGREVMA